MRTQPLPESCARCRGTRLVRVLWDHSAFTPEETQALALEQAYLGLSHRYFTSVDPTLVVGGLVVKRCRLPTWACLDCSPQWSDVNRLAKEELEAGSAKSAAVEAGDFERAAALFDQQRRLEAAHVAKFERLLRELVPLGSSSPGGA
jgi:hypothetical protein